jgi:hypothetical protein
MGGRRVAFSRRSALLGVVASLGFRRKTGPFSDPNKTGRIDVPRSARFSGPIYLSKEKANERDKTRYTR